MPRPLAVDVDAGLDVIMKKVAAVVGFAGAFAAGVAVGKVTPAPVAPKFTAAEELKWEDVGGGLKLATLYGDHEKTAFGGLLRVPAGHTSPLHSHSGAYESVQISGTSSHWMKGEDGTKAKKMTPGSYWMIPAKTEHVSSCAAGADCIVFRWQKTKYDVAPSKDAPPAAAATSGAPAAKSGGMGSGSQASPKK